MVAELTALRDQIDEVDKALLDLLARRLELVAEVGEVKSRFGLPIYVPEREASMLASRRAEAEALGVPPSTLSFHFRALEAAGLIAASVALILRAFSSYISIATLSPA